MQEIDAQRRLAILRGEAPPHVPEQDDEKALEPERQDRISKSEQYGSTRRKRKRYGEDDTEFELRLAMEKAHSTDKAIEVSTKPSSSAPIFDHHGHIDLFGDERSRAHADKNPEAERERQKQKQEYEDQYTMRFSNAAGKNATSKPWYSQADAAQEETAPLKDVWGNHDPRRKQRDTDRIASSDPLHMMKKGASRVRELKKERKRFQEEREEELRQMRRDERRRHKHKRREGRDERPRSLSPRLDTMRRRSRDRSNGRHMEEDNREQQQHEHREYRHRRREHAREYDSTRHGGRSLREAKE